MEGNREIFVEASNHDAGWLFQTGYLVSKFLSLAIRGDVTFILALSLTRLLWQMLPALL